MISWRTSVTSGSASMRAVMAAAKSSRLTASALPAGTAVSRATAMTALPRAAISTLSSPTAVTGSSERRELEQTSSANSGLTWAGE